MQTVRISVPRNALRDGLHWACTQCTIQNWSWFFTSTHNNGVNWETVGVEGKKLVNMYKKRCLFIILDKLRLLSQKGFFY